MIDNYLERILKARVYDVAVESPLETARNLSQRLGCQVLLKREDLQPVFSFKLRGAYNKLAHQSQEALRRGVICSSSGNHAQGVALAARQLGTQATIVSPNTTPRIKIEAAQALGGDVVLHGETYDEAYEHAMALAEAKGLTFVHPFNDPDVIAGQGTIGLEILRQHQGAVDAIYVPVGGGGLIGGIGAYVKSLFPEIRVIGVEPEESASMHAALAAGGPVTLDHVGIFADAVAVRRVGDETYRLAARYVDDILLVSTDEMAAAIRDIFEDTRTIVEPAGALAVAGLKKDVAERGLRRQTLVAVNGGANVNFDRLRHIAERADIGEHREALLAVEIPERPGSFRTFCERIGKRHVTEFNYRYGDRELARIFVGVELSRGVEEKRELIRHLGEHGYPVFDLTDNEVAKLHVRHMVGGLAPEVSDEVLYRFEFPERRGALMDFLRAIGDQWNISLFHYRNHGSDYGRVLAGAQVPEAERGEFRRHLEELGYAHWEETSNVAYEIFLASATAGIVSK